MKTPQPKTKKPVAKKTAVKRAVKRKQASKQAKPRQKLPKAEKPAPAIRKRKATGRKTKLTRELIGKIAECLRNHNTQRSTCGHLGIHPGTLCRWVSEGQEEKSGRKRELSEAVKRAQAFSVAELVNKIAEDPSWQSKAWLLERMYPKQYGRRQLIAHAGADGESPVKTEATAAPIVNIILHKTGEPDPWTYAEDDEE